MIQILVCWKLLPKLSHTTLPVRGRGVQGDMIVSSFISQPNSLGELWNRPLAHAGILGVSKYPSWQALASKSGSTGWYWWGSQGGLVHFIPVGFQHPQRDVGLAPQWAMEWAQEGRRADVEHCHHFWYFQWQNVYQKRRGIIITRGIASDWTEWDVEFAMFIVFRNVEGKLPWFSSLWRRPD